MREILNVKSASCYLDSILLIIKLILCNYYYFILQHGYPNRRRSLVGDAKFETVKNREAKLSWLQESRSSSQDFDLSEEEVKGIVENIICHFYFSQVIVVSETNENKDFTSLKKSNLMISLKEDGFNDLARVLKLVQVQLMLIKLHLHFIPLYRFIA